MMDEAIIKSAKNIVLKKANKEEKAEVATKLVDLENKIDLILTKLGQLQQQ